MTDISHLQDKLKTLEAKLLKLQSGELSAENTPGESDAVTRQKENIQRTELFIRQLKGAIADATTPAVPAIIPVSPAVLTTPAKKK